MDVPSPLDAHGFLYAWDKGTRQNVSKDPHPYFGDIRTSSTRGKTRTYMRRGVTVWRVAYVGSLSVVSLLHGVIYSGGG